MGSERVKKKKEGSEAYVPWSEGEKERQTDKLTYTDTDLTHRQRKRKKAVKSRETQREGQ